MPSRSIPVLSSRSLSRRLTRSAGAYLFITITLFAAVPTHLRAQQLTTQAPPQATEPEYPELVPILPPARADSPVIASDVQTFKAGVFTLAGHVVITSGKGRDLRRVEADSVLYDSNTGQLTLTGHILVTAALNDERITAAHATYNLRTATGTFYDVTGSVGIKPRAPLLPTPAPVATSATGLALVPTRRVVYTTTNPFLFSGRMVVKSGPRVYDIYNGSVTSCLLPHPDWLLSAAHFSVTADQATAHNSTFRLLNIPILYLPYVTHPTNSEHRSSGFLIPTIGESSTRGLVLGEQIYLTLGRSADLVFGAEYYSMIGFEQNAAFRYRGRDLDFLTVRYNGVLDRRSGILNQGGEDLLLNGRRDLTPNTRAVVNAEYLSSYTYREAFSNEFNQAVTSDILSTAFVSTHRDGFELAGFADRYQGIKLIAQGTTPQQQVRIFHAPTLLVSSVPRRIGLANLQFSLDSTFSGLKRTQPNFATGGIVERFDVHPRLAYPLHFEGISIVPTLGAEETVYSRSRVTPVGTAPPVESLASLTRSSLDFTLEIRPPVIERTFAPPPRLARIFGTEVRHTISPELTYRRTAGIDNFANILRFDQLDVAADTNELEYGVTQRLYLRKSATHPCRNAGDFDAGLNPQGTGVATVFPTRSSAGTNTPDPESTLANASEAETDSGALSPFAPSSDSASSPDSDPSMSSSRSRAGASASPGSPRRRRAATAVIANCQSEELISWRLAQKHFFDSTFGGAIANGRRNIFTTTLDFSGIAFLTEPRQISPLVSRLRVRTSASTDVEWDFDLDTGASKFTSSNVFIDLHHANFFTALSYARLDAPGRFYTEGESSSNAAATGVSSNVSDFNQLRYLIGYGNPAKPGLSIAANTGLDLKSLYGATNTTTTRGVTTSTTVYPALFQYATVQASYNWNCCGVAFEYRKFNLGAIHNEPGYRFSFSLANIGTAGNLRRAERLF